MLKLIFQNSSKLCFNRSEHEGNSSSTTTQATSGLTSLIPENPQKWVWKMILKMIFQIFIQVFLFHLAWFSIIYSSIERPNWKSDTKPVSCTARPLQSFFPFVKRLSERDFSWITTLMSFKLFCFTKSKQNRKDFGRIEYTGNPWAPNTRVRYSQSS